MNNIDIKNSASAVASTPTIVEGNQEPIDIKLIIFDLGKVFIRFEWEPIYKAFAQATNTDLQTVKDAFAVIYFPYERGHLTTRNVIDHFNKSLNTRLTHAEFSQMWTSTLDEDTEMTQLLQELRKQIPLYLLSNINEVSFGYVQDKFNVSRHFDELVLSYKVGHIKPAVEIYHEILNRSNLPAKNCLFIDDMPENIEAAKSVGIHGIQFTGINDLRKKLPEFGIKI